MRRPTDLLRGLRQWRERAVLRDGAVAQGKDALVVVPHEAEARVDEEAAAAACWMWEGGGQGEA